jgi:hypothetical protein
VTKFAWPSYQDPWECVVTGVELDGAAGTLEINGDHFRVDAYDSVWQIAELEVAVTTGEAQPAGLNDLRAHVLLSCPATQVRRSYPLALDDTESDLKFKGTLRIPRNAVAGKALLTAEVVGSHDGRVRIVGSTVPWGLIVDKSEAPDRPGVPPLKTVWIDFADSASPNEARRNSDAHAYVDVAASPPVLYLNKGIDGLQLLILSNNAKLERRRHRDMLGAAIARYVANALFRAAVEQVTSDDPGERPEGPADRVLRDMCEAVAAELTSTETVDDLYEALAELREGTAASASFWADVDLALNRMTGLSSTIARICDEVKHV